MTTPWDISRQRAPKWDAACAGVALTALLVSRSIATDPGAPPSDAPGPQGIVWIPAADFSMGDDAFPDARPVHRVSVDGFWIDKPEVPNAHFARIVRAGAYVTVADKPPDPKEFPGVPAEDLKPGSIVFTPPDHPV